MQKISDLVYSKKITFGNFYLGAMNFGNADFPVYCHDNSPVDPDSLIYPPSSKPDGTLYIYFNTTNPLRDSQFGMYNYPNIGWSMICQDP
jgi:hypothetical protein